ncbi:MAG TPA: molybdenum cofactor guanylyltransferase [Candidatus Sulfotelmatobacter sp.]|nr:molybdenum cofactor guanylyltransferase [Candidatus Sulfotelmatobacter sp.]
MIGRVQSSDKNLSAFVLAGGKSTRMGSDKAFVMLGGRTLLSRALDLARSITQNVSVVGDAAKFAGYAPTVEDVFPNCGPLGGIHGALRSSSSELNLILAVDLPLIRPEFLGYLVTRAESAPSALVTLAHTGAGWQPLCALYRRQFADLAEPALRAARFKIDALFDESRIQRITEAELQAAGFPLTIFRNLNTPGDLAEALEEERRATHPEPL